MRYRAGEDTGVISKIAGKKSRAAAWLKGQEIVDGLNDLAATMQAGEPLESRLTVRTYKIAPPPAYDAAGMPGCARGWRWVRGFSPRCSGVDPSTVRSWEQELRVPSPLAC